MSVLVHIGFAIKNLFPTFLKWLKHNKDKIKDKSFDLSFMVGRSGLVLDLLHAREVSPLWFYHSRLNSLAIRICSLRSLHPSANPPNHHLSVSRNTTPYKKRQDKPTSFYMGRSGLEPPTSPLSGVRSNHLSQQPLFRVSNALALSH